MLEDRAYQKADTIPSDIKIIAIDEETLSRCVNGKSIAHLQPDAESKYVISSIEEVEVKEFNWN